MRSDFDRKVDNIMGRIGKGIGVIFWTVITCTIVYLICRFLVWLLGWYLLALPPVFVFFYFFGTLCEAVEYSDTWAELKQRMKRQVKEDMDLFKKGK